MKSDRDRIIENLSPIELLMYVEGGGRIVSNGMQVRFRRLLRSVGLEIAPDATALAALALERLPRGTPKRPKPLVYLPGRPAAGMHRSRNVGRKVRAA